MSSAQGKGRGGMAGTAVGAALLSLIAGCQTFTPSPHAALPQVSANRGDLLAPLRIVTITTPDNPLGPSLFAFSDALIASDWWKTVGDEYGLGAAAGSVHVIGPPIVADFSEHDLFDYVTAIIESGAAGTLGDDGARMRDGNTLYLVYLPDDINLVYDGVENIYCSLIGGYHRPFHVDGDGLAVVQRCVPYPSDTSLQLDLTTVIGSHEIFEAATDPTGYGYRLTQSTSEPLTVQSVWLALPELGDLCTGTTIREEPYLYQRMYSNRAAAALGDPCVPALPAPYFSVTTNDKWWPMAAGNTLTIPFSAWSSAPIDGWVVAAEPLEVSAGITIVGVAIEGQGPPDPSNPSAGMNNGDRGLVYVTIDPAAISGSTAVIAIDSYQPMLPGTDGDRDRYILTGVYVP